MSLSLLSQFNIYLFEIWKVKFNEINEIMKQFTLNGGRTPKKLFLLLLKGALAENYGL